MAAALTDKFRKTGTSTVTTLAAPGKAIGASSINVGSTTNYPSDTGVIVTIRVVDSNGTLVAGTQTEFKGIVAGATSITIDPTPVYGTDQVYAAGSTTQVLIALSSFAHNDMVDALLVTHNQDGTLKTSIVDYSKIATKFRQGWDTLATSGIRVSATQFIVLGNITSLLRVGQPVEFTDTTTKYGHIISYSYSSPNTTINLAANTDYALVGNPTNIYGGLHSSPVGFPDWFSYIPTLTVSGGTTPTYTTFQNRFRIDGKKCEVISGWKNTSGGTAGAGSATIVSTLPVTSSNNFTADLTSIGSGRYYEAATANLIEVIQYSTSQYYAIKPDGTGLIGTDQDQVARGVSINFKYEI